MNEGTGRRVAVIGAGAAGLAAAWRLQLAGAGVDVYEAAAHAGGLLRTEALCGLHVDSAVQLVSSTYTRLFALATEAGARELLVGSSGHDALWRNGRAQEITYGSIASMAVTGALPAMLKLKLATKYAPFLTMQLGRLDANDPAGTGGDRHDGESIAAWGHRELGADFVELLTYPLLAAYYGSTPEQTSAALYHALARVGMDVQVYAVTGGVASLAKAVAQALASKGANIHMRTTVASLKNTEDGKWRIACAVDTGRESRSYDSVVVATSPLSAWKLVTSIHAEYTSGDTHVPPLARWLEGVRTHAAATVGLAVDGTMRTPYFGLSLPRATPPGDRIVAITMQQNKPAGLIPPGSSALVLFPSPAVVERVSHMSADEALAYFGPSLERIYPGLLPRVRGAAVYAGDARYRDMGPGFIHRIQEFRGLTMPQGLAIAGDYTHVPTVEGAVRSGERAAAAVMRA